MTFSLSLAKSDLSAEPAVSRLEQRSSEAPSSLSYPLVLVFFWDRELASVAPELVYQCFQADHPAIAMIMILGCG